MRAEPVAAPPPDVPMDGAGVPHPVPSTDHADPWLRASRALDLEGRMTRQPHQTVLIAAALGFLASGALFSRFSLRALGVAVRLAVLPALEEQLTPRSAAERPRSAEPDCVAPAAQRPCGDVVSPLVLPLNDGV